MAMILVATDGSQSANAATQIAFELARTSGDDLLFVAAWRELRGDFGIPLHELIPDLVEVEREWARETLQQAGAEAEAEGLPAAVVSRHGSPVDGSLRSLIHLTRTGVRHPASIVKAG